jgi:hypothetical protein
MACVEYPGNDGYYHLGEYAYSSGDTTYYTACRCEWYNDANGSHYGTWYTAAGGDLQWADCSIGGRSDPGAGLIILAVFVGIAVLIGLIIAAASSGKSSPAKRSPLDPPPTQIHSKIKLSDFVADKVAPKAPTSVPPVDEMTWEFGEPGTTVKLYLALSQEERAIIKRWGLDELPLEEEPLFDDTALDKLAEAQQKELLQEKDEGTLAALRIEHRQQIKTAKAQKWGRTIEYYLQWPYTREFETRFQATQYRNSLERQILPNFRKTLEEYAKR